MALIQRIIKYKTAFFISLILALLQVFSTLYSGNKITPIKGDAQAYYAYLPAAFIYQDFEFNFVDSINQKHYSPNDRKSFLVNVGDKKVNKTFPGAAIYYLPSFLVAHGIALLFNLDSDGYSTIYQLSFNLNYWLFFFLSLFFLHKVLALLKFNTTQIHWSIAIIGLGTNVVFYSFYNQSVTHIFNFFTVNLIVFLCLRFISEKKISQLILILSLMALLGITRPTNFLIFFLIPIFIPLKDFGTSIVSLLKKWPKLILFLTIPAFILFLPFILWKIQTGNWIVYSYGEEGFNFSHPEFVNFTFSYIKGWFTYTPIALLIVVVGITILWRSDKRKFIWTLLLYLISIYVYASWWCWYYGAGHGQRVMIDFYLVLGFLTATILRYLDQKPRLKQIFLSLSIIFCFFNITQAYQISQGILPHGSPTKAQYWDNLFSYKRKARVYPHEHWELTHQKTFNLSPGSNDIYKGNAYQSTETKYIQVADFEPYSANIKLDSMDFTLHSRFIVSFYARCNSSITLTRCVLDFQGKHDVHVFSFGQYLEEGEWVLIEFKFEPFHNFSTAPILYFWNGDSKEKVEIKDLEYKHYSTPTYM